MVSHAAVGWETGVERLVSFDGVRAHGGGRPASGLFAIRVATATNPTVDDAVFHATDLLSEYVGVYRAGNGRRLFAVDIPSPVPSWQTFALSPNGDQLAVLRENQIDFYALPGPIEAQK